MLLHADREFNLALVVVIDQLDVFPLDVKDRRTDRHLESQARSFGRGPRQLFFHPSKLVAVDVNITARPDELTRCVTELVSDHDGQKSIAGDVERHTDWKICTQNCSYVSLLRSAPLRAAGITTGVGIHHSLRP